MLTIFEVTAATSMVVSYAPEDRHQRWIAVFTLGGAATAAVYGIPTRAWIFVGLETVWAVITMTRFRVTQARA
jgi:hypothetical protein